jgi:V8-like Glu-specific endopeptidase
MFAFLEKELDIQDDKIIYYDYIDTSNGQSGSPVILKKDNIHQIVGVHTGHSGGSNLGTFIGSLTYESFSQIFSQGNNII